jgi:hypothetical protein
MTRRVGCWLVLLCIFTLLGGCVTGWAEARCERMRPPLLTKYLGQPLPPLEQLTAEIKATGRVEDLTFYPPSAPGEAVPPSEVSWHGDNGKYTLGVKPGINTWSSLLYSPRTRPTLPQAVACFGAPHAYWASYRATGQGSGWASEVLLLYPDQGILIGGIDLGPRRTAADGSLRDPASLAAVRADAVVYMPSTTSAALLAQAYYFEEEDAPEALRHWYLDHITPWPGSWNALEVLREPRPFAE